LWVPGIKWAGARHCPYVKYASYGCPLWVPGIKWAGARHCPYVANTINFYYFYSIDIFILLFNFMLKIIQ
jgi:hypothetical protein